MPLERVVAFLNMLTKWFFRGMLVATVIVIVFGAALSVSSHAWTLAVIQTFLLLPISVNSVRVMVRREANAPPASVIPLWFQVAKLVGFWGTVGLAVAIVALLGHPRP